MEEFKFRRLQWDCKRCIFVVELEEVRFALLDKKSRWMDFSGGGTFIWEAEGSLQKN